MAFEFRSDLRTHVATYHENDLPYKCSYCGKGYWSSTGLSLHLQVHEGKSFVCPICDAKFTQKGTMKTHMKMKHRSSMCSICSQVLKLGPEYNEHIVNCTKLPKS